MDNENQSPKNSGPACDCCKDSTTQSPDGTSVDNEKQYKALVLACIDPRMQKPVYRYLSKDRDLKGKYSQVTIAGGAIAAVASKFEAWHQTFWDNLSISLNLHRIRKVIVIQHRDCGAARAAYGHFEHGGETKLHRAVAQEFRKQLAQRHPQLRLEAILMNLKGRHKDLLGR